MGTQGAQQARRQLGERALGDTARAGRARGAGRWAARAGRAGVGAAGTRGAGRECAGRAGRMVWACQCAQAGRAPGSVLTQFLTGLTRYYSGVTK